MTFYNNLFHKRTYRQHIVLESSNDEWEERGWATGYMLLLLNETFYLSWFSEDMTFSRTDSVFGEETNDFSCCWSGSIDEVVFLMENYRDPIITSRRITEEDHDYILLSKLYSAFLEYLKNPEILLTYSHLNVRNFGKLLTTYKLNNAFTKSL